MNRVSNSIRNSGWLLAIFRLPFRAVMSFLNSVNSKWWKLHLRNLGSGSIIELGVKIEQPTQVSIGNNCRIAKGSILTAESNGKILKISDDVMINNNVRIDHSGGLYIGERTVISNDALLYSHSHGLKPKSEPVGINKHIGNDVWIGVRAIILEKCSNIPDNTIVAAGSVVPKSLEGSGVFAGSRAKKIKSL